MRTRTAATAATLILAAALTACGSSDHASTEPKAAAKAPAPKVSPSVDCSDTSLSQADWVKSCSGKAGPDGEGKETASDTKPMPLGKTVETIGAQAPVSGKGGGGLEVTPTTIVYAKKAMGEVAVNGTFAIITVKDKAPNAVAAAESAPIEGGGWQWAAPDGQAIDEGENDASSITPQGFTGGGMVQPGTYAWRTIAFDLTEAQRGGTIMYTDGAGHTFRWAMPATEKGPELAQLKKGMAGNYG
jgi:hypothetical protein